MSDASGNRLVCWRLLPWRPPSFSTSHSMAQFSPEQFRWIAVPLSAAHKIPPEGQRSTPAMRLMAGMRGNFGHDLVPTPMPSSVYTADGHRPPRRCHVKSGFIVPDQPDGSYMYYQKIKLLCLREKRPRPWLFPAMNFSRSSAQGNASVMRWCLLVAVGRRPLRSHRQRAQRPHGQSNRLTAARRFDHEPGRRDPPPQPGPVLIAHQPGCVTGAGRLQAEPGAHWCTRAAPPVACRFDVGAVRGCARRWCNFAPIAASCRRSEACWWTTTSGLQPAKLCTGPRLARDRSRLGKHQRKVPATAAGEVTSPVPLGGT